MSPKRKGLYLDEVDEQLIYEIIKAYGCSSESQAVRLALRALVARPLFPGVPLPEAGALGPKKSTNDGQHLLFTYGTLQDSDVQQRIIGRVACVEAETLSGYALLRLERWPYPAITRRVGSSVDGKAFYLSTAELVKCDHYEGTHYRRVEISLESRRKAWVYEWAG